jgi:hypothetical protein
MVTESEREKAPMCSVVAMAPTTAVELDSWSDAASGPATATASACETVQESELVSAVELA